MIQTERPDDFADRNLFLQLVLGLIGEGRVLDRLAARRSESEPVDGDDPALLAVLGALALHRAVESFAAREASAPIVERTHVAHGDQLEGILR